MTALRSIRLIFPLVLAACGASPAPESGVPEGTGTTASPPIAVPGGTAQPPTKPEPIPTPPSGKHMGATPYEGGVEVRVWAPNAKAVAVVGELAGASGRRSLSPEPGGTGMYSARIDGGRAGQTYRFSITTQDGSELSRVDPRAREIAGNESRVVDPRAYAWKSKPFTPPARANAIVYEMHIGSFHAPGGVNTGTFASAIEKLDALAELGVNVVELMPVNGHGGHGWGYGPQQWYAPHPAYGGPDDLRRFVDEAHARGIAVVLDIVFNHMDGWAQAPLRCFDAPCSATSSGVYFFEEEPYRRTPWGPRPNFAKKEVSDFFVDNVFAWTKEYRIDGFRHDSVSNIRAIDGQGTVPGGSDLLRRMNEVTEAALPGALLVAEDLKGWSGITLARGSGGLGFHTQWDGGFHWAVTGAASAAGDDARDLGAVRGALLNAYNGDPFQRVMYVESHDTAGNDGQRLPVRIDAADPKSLDSRRRGMVAAGLLFTAPGVPMLFQGQEMLDEVKFVPQPSPLDWSKATTPENAGFRTFYRDAIKLRRTEAGLAGAHVAITHLNDTGGNKVLVMRRWNKGGDDVMVIANFGSKSYTRYDVGVPSAAAWTARIDSNAVRYGADLGSASPTTVQVLATPRDGLPATAAITLASYSLVVLTK